MDKRRREQLEKRRSILQGEVERKEIKDRLSYLIPFLENAGFNYKIYYENEYLNWLYENVDVRKKDGYHGVHEDFQINIHDAEAKEFITLNYKDLKTESFSKEFLTLISEEENFVLCQLGGYPDIETSFQAFLEDSKKFLRIFGVWLVSAKKEWVIEYIFGQGVIRFIKLIDSKPTIYKVIKLVNDD